MVQQDHFCPVMDYAKNLHVSTRTVYSYLSELQKTIERFECTLEKTPGKGILLNGTAINKKKLVSYLKDERYAIDLSPDERRHTILYRLLQQETISYRKLSEEFYVSRSTVVNDMKWIKNEFFLPQMELVSHSK